MGNPLKKTSNTKFYRDVIHPYFEIKTCFCDNHVFNEHCHEELSIGLIDEGSGIVSYYGKTFTVTPKHAIIVPSNIVHKCNAINMNNWSYRMLYINAEWFQSLFLEEVKDFKPSIQYIDLKSYLKINNVFEVLQGTSPQIDKESQLITMLNNFFYFETLVNNKSFNKHVKKIFEYINDNFLEEITLDDLAYITRVSKFYVIRLFKSTYGTSPHKYQTMLKVNYAKKALKSGKCITEAALMSGFCDQSHFTKAFTKYMGITPLNFSGCK